MPPLTTAAPGPDELAVVTVVLMSLTMVDGTIASGVGRPDGPRAGAAPPRARCADSSTRESSPGDCSEQPAIDVKSTAARNVLERTEEGGMGAGILVQGTRWTSSR